MFTNTGAPQGTVLAPFLFSMYTADCRSSQTDCVIDKYADDTVLTGLITDNDEHYRQEIDSLVQWCERSYLQLHVGKTREMIMDFRRNNDQSAPVVIRGGAIERLAVYNIWESILTVSSAGKRTQTWSLRKPILVSFVSGS